MHELLDAILEDDRRGVRRLLKSDAALATRQIDKPKLYRGKITHWLYAGDTALHLAAAGHRVEIARLLLAAGADPNASANHRRSRPLHYAADGYVVSASWNAAHQVKTIQCLLKAGADKNAQDNNGATPLHRAVRTRCADAVRCLLLAGVRPTLKNNAGSTPFHLAVQNTGRGGSGAEVAKNGQRRIIEDFFARGVSTKSRDGSGRSVINCAQSDWIRELLVHD
jgi:Ankyrin repeats (many copies)